MPRILWAIYHGLLVIILSLLCWAAIIGAGEAAKALLLFVVSLPLYVGGPLFFVILAVIAGMRYYSE